MLQLKVQMGFGGVAGISTLGNLLPPFDSLSDGYKDTAWFEVSQQRVFLFCVEKQYIVSTDIPGITDGLSSGSDPTVRLSCGYFRYYAISRSKNVLSIAIKRGWVCLRAVKAFAFCVKYDKVISVSLGGNIPGVGCSFRNTSVYNNPFSLKRKRIFCAQTAVPYIREVPVVSVLQCDDASHLFQRLEKCRNIHFNGLPCSV